MNPRALGDPVIIIPAWNEEKNIGRTLNLVSKTGISARVIVVDDGSVDNTSRVAQSKGYSVVRLPTNVGKAGAFFAGLKKALRLTPLPVAIVTLDADSVRLPKKDLQRLIDVAKRHTLGNRTRMVVTAPLESRFNSDFLRFFSHTRSNSSFRFSGTRSFSLQAAMALNQTRLKSRAKGYGLEVFQNTFFPKDRQIKVNTQIKILPPFRRDDVRGDRVRDEVGKTAIHKRRIRNDLQRIRRFSVH